MSCLAPHTLLHARRTGLPLPGRTLQYCIWGTSPLIRPGLQRSHRPPIQRLWSMKWKRSMSHSDTKTPTGFSVLCFLTEGTDLNRNDRLDDQTCTMITLTLGTYSHVSLLFFGLISSSITFSQASHLFVYLHRAMLSIIPVANLPLLLYTTSLPCSRYWTIHRLHFWLFDLTDGLAMGQTLTKSTDTRPTNCGQYYSYPV